MSYTLDAVRGLLRGLGADPVYFGDRDAATCCYGRTAAAGLVTIRFIGVATVTVGDTTFSVSDRETLPQLISRVVPTRAKLEQAAMIPKRSKPVCNYRARDAD